MVTLTQLKNLSPGAIKLLNLGEYQVCYYVRENGNIDVDLILEDDSFKVPFELVDEWLKDTKPRKVAGTSYAAEYVAAICNRIAPEIHSYAFDLPVSYWPKVIKNLLLDMANPMVNYQPWESRG